MNYALVHRGHNRWRDHQGKLTNKFNGKMFLCNNKLYQWLKNIKELNSQSTKNEIHKKDKYQKTHQCLNDQCRKSHTPKKNKTNILRDGEWKGEKQYVKKYKI